MDHNNKETVPVDTSKESSSIGQNDNVENVETSHYDEKRAVDHSHKDKAAIFLQNQERLEVTPEENKRILKRIDLRLLPILLVVYFLQQLDKSVLSYSSVFGLIEDAKLVGQEYSWLGSVIYIAQLVMQPLIAVLCKYRTYRCDVLAALLAKEHSHSNFKISSLSRVNTLSVEIC